MGIWGLYKKQSIRAKMLMVFFVQVVIPLLLIGVFFYAKMNSAMEEHALSLTLDTLKIIKIRTEDFLDNVNVISQDMLYDQEIYDVLLDDQTDSYAYYNKVNKVKNILRKRALSFDSIQSITIVSQNGQFLSYDTNSGRANIESILPYKAIMKEARQAGGGIVWYIDSSNKNVFLARVINDRDTYDEIGLLAILISEEDLKKTFDQLSSDTLENVAIITPGQDVIYADGEDPVWMKDVNLSSTDPIGYTRESDDNNIIAYVKLDDLDWYIVTKFSKSVILEDLYPMSEWIINIFIPMIILLGIITVLIAMDIVNPIQKIVKYMKRFQMGKKPEPLSLDRQDEFGYLADTLESMITEIDYLMNTVMNEQILRREVQIKALQAQINPHFLFNTLETINWRAQLIDAPEISEMVTSLSGILEANISRDIKPIPLKQEMTYVHNYLAIMRHRYEERLKIKWEIEDTPLQLKVPQLLLQPIVENAIKHGVGKTARIGVILIRVIATEALIEIDVVDNGTGLEPEEVIKLNQRFQETTYRMDKLKNASIGLDNVNQRIKLQFGEMYGLAVESRKGYYTKVIVTLPNSNMGEDVSS